MSELLARLARTLTQHWKRSLGAALPVIVLLGAAAGAGGEARRLLDPGTESQKALDLFKAHSPAFAGADSTLVFTVKDGKVDRRRARVKPSPARWTRSRSWTAWSRSPTRSRAAAPCRRTASSRRSTCRYSTDPADLEKSDGEALLDAGKSAEGGGVQVQARGVLIDLASEQDAPVGELIGVGVAIILLTLLFRSVVAMIATLVGALIGVMVGQICWPRWPRLWTSPPSPP